MRTKHKHGNTSGLTTKWLIKFGACFLLTLTVPITLTIKSLIFSELNAETAISWLDGSMEVLTSYIGSLVSLVAIAVTLPAIFLDRDAKIEALRNTFDKTVDRRGIVRRIHALKNFITPPFVYIYSTFSTAIIAGYLVPAPDWVCNGERGWACQIIWALQDNAAVVTTFLLLSTVLLVGVFIWLLIEHSKTKLLEDIRQACIRQADENSGYIDRELIKLVGEVGHLCYRGKDKKSSIATIQAIVEGADALNHETMFSLANAVTEAVESGDKDNYQQALEVVQEITKLATEDEGNRDQSIAMIWGEFTELLVGAIRLSIGLNLRSYLDEFKVDDEQLKRGFGNVSARQLVKVGITAIEEKKPQIAYSAFDKLHGEAIGVVESETWSANGEVIHQFFGLFAHLWTYNKASQFVLRPFIDSFMDVVRDGGRPDATLPTFVQGAKAFFVETTELVATATKLEEVLYVIKQRNLVKRYLQDLLGAEEGELYYDRIVYHYPSVEALQEANLYSVMACDVPEPVAQQLLKRD